MEQVKKTKNNIYIRSIIAAFLLLSGFSASAQFDLDIEVTNACSGPNSGAIEITILNDLVGGAFTYDWAGPSGFTSTTAVGFIATPEPGTYTVMVTRTADAAMRNATIDVLQSAVPLGFNPAVVTGTSCNGGDGAITITGANGTGPYVYAIIPYPGVPATVADFGGFVPNNGVFNGLDIDQYSVVVRDALGCIEIQDQIAVNQIASTIAITLDGSTNATCNLGNDGGIAVSGNGGVGNYTFSIIPGGGGSTAPDFELAGYQANGGLFPSLPANTYDLAVKDDNGCVAIRNGVAITEPDPIVLTQEVRFTTCDSLQTPDLDDGNGRINILTTLGGTPPYTYEWEGPNGFTDTGLAINNLIAGDYAVTVTDGNMCERQFPFVIYNGFELQAIPTNVSCKEADDGLITLNIIWDDLRDNGNIANLPHGQPGINQFVQWDKIELGVPIAQIDVDNDVMITGLGPGTYVATVTDLFNCVKRDTVEITEPSDAFDITNIDITNNRCIGDTEGIIEITATGGGSAAYEYSIDNGANFQQESIFQNIAAGTYTIVARDIVNGCSDTEIRDVTEPATTFFIDAVNTTSISCFNDPDNGQAEVVISKTDPLHPITDINWYSINDPVPIVNSTQPTLIEQLANLSEGAYYVEVIDDFGCVKTEDFLINRPEEFRFVLSTQNIPCPEGGDIDLTVTVEGGTSDYTYIWTFGALSLLTETKAGTSSTLSLPNSDATDAGQYVVRVVDDNSCEIFEQFDIIIPDPIVIVPNPINQNACIGAAEGSIDVTVTGGTPIAGTSYKYTWFKDGVEFSTSQNITDLEAGEYRVDVTDANDCDPVSETVFITDPTTTYRIDTVAINPVVCNGETTGSIDVDIVVDAGHPTLANQFTYTWYKDGVFFRPNAIDLVGDVGPGIYELAINDNYFGAGQGCEQSATFEVVEFNTITINPVFIDNTCPGLDDASITLSPTGGLAVTDYSYSWTFNTAAFPGGASITMLEGGTYRVTVTDDLGCAVQQTFNVTNFTDFSVDATSVTPISCHDANDGTIDVQVSGINGTARYTWLKDGFFFSSDEDISDLEPGTYELEVADLVGIEECTVFNLTETLTNPFEYFIAETITNVTCNAGNDGLISVTINQGGPDIATGNITFRWTDEGGSPIDPGINKTFIDNLTAGIYNLEIEDLSGCVTSAQFEVIEYLEIFPNATIEQLTCPGPANLTASITVTPQGGNTSVAGPAGYNYSWTRNGMSIPGTTNSQTGLDEGTYVVTITDNSGCSVPFEQIIDPIPDYVITESVEQITCSGETDGAINLRVVGGSGTITYQWSLNGSIISEEDSIQNLSPGDYEVEVLDDLSGGEFCIAHTATYTITDPGTFTVTPTVTDVTCDEINDGSINLNLTNIPAGFTTADFTFTFTRLADNAVVASTLSTAINLESGLYRVDITHDSFSPGITSSCTESFEYEVINFEPITITPTVIPNECPGEDEGQISIVIDGGSGPYNIEWRKNGVVEGAQDVLLRMNLGAGLYDITVTDQATTCAESTQISIEFIEDFTIDAEVTDLTCQSAANGGSDNGSINLDVTGGTGDLTYLWVALADGEVLDDSPFQENLAPGDYQITVRDENTCVALNTSYTINEPPASSIILDNLSPVRCNGESNGSVTVSFQDHLTAPISSNQFDKVWYTITPEPGGAPPTLTEIIGQTGATLSGMLAGDYRLVATENNPTSNNCVLERDFTIIEYDQLTIDNIITSQLSCDDSDDGSIQLEVSGGNAPTNDDYTVQWTLNGVPFTDLDLSTNLEITDLGVGSYKAVVFDLSGCSITENEVIVEHEAISVANPVVTQISCFNTTPNGSITIGVSGGTAPYSFDWSKDGVANFSSDQNLADLEPGTYTVLIDDVNTCSSGPITSQDFIIETPPSYDITAVIDNETCLGDNDGAIDITINVTPGSATTLNPSLFDYTWYYNDAELLQFKDQRDIDDLTAGTYRIDVIDNTTGACAESMEFELVAFEDLQLNSAVSQITCPGDDDGIISVDPIGGSPNGPPTIEWYQNDVLLADSTGNLSIRGLGADAYRVVVTDAEGCATDERFIINELINITVPQENVTITQIMCIGETNGEIAINIEGGTGPFDILWQKDGAFFSEEQGVLAADTAESRISDLANGVYAVVINDLNSCTPFTASYTIDERTTTFTGGVGRPQAITCFNASDGILNAVIIPDAGHPTDFEVEWFKDDATVAFSTEIEVGQLGPGTYRAEVTDAFGCMKAASVTLINPDPIFARAAVTELICNDAQTAIIQLDPIGGYGEFTTTWSEATLGIIDNPGFRLAGLGAGEYTISLADTVGCVKDTTILILNPIAINLLPVVQNVDCQGSPSGSIDLNVTEGTAPYTFQWRRDSTLISLDEDLSEIVAGNYTVRVEDANGCVVNSDTIQVTEPEVSFTIQAEIDRVTCNNGTDGSIKPIIVEEGGTSTYRFNWYKDSVLFALDTETLVGISPGLYTIEVEDANGCIKTRNYEIINPPVLDVNHVTEDLSCFRSGDGAISVQAIGGYGNYTYEWSTGGEVLSDTTARISNLQVGIYQVVIADAEGCDITRRFQVRQPLPIIIEIVKEDNTCPGPFDAFITPTVSGGRPPYTFLWERNGEPFTDSLAIDSLAPAEYVLTVTDSSLCDVKTDPIIIEAPDPLGFNFLEFVDNLCPTTENGMISVQGIGGTSPYVFSFDSSAFDVSNDFFGLAKGKYPLSVMDDVGCVTDTIIEINHQYDLQPDFTYSFQELAIDYDISFEDQTVGPALTKWFWDFGDERASPEEDPVIQFESVGEYVVSLTVENEVECVATFSDTLQVEQGYVFTIPSGFSPNGDGLNDFFRPVFDNINDIRTNIVDRNGEIVFTSDSREEFWDGRLNGDRLPQGPYYYEISYTSRAGKTRFRKGKVLLLR